MGACFSDSSTSEQPETIPGVSGLAPNPNASGVLASAPEPTPSGTVTTPPEPTPSGVATTPPETTPTASSSPIICATDTGVYVSANDENIQRSDWFYSEPLDRNALDRLQTVQLHTVSRDQGWVSDPNAGAWSWFELSVQRQDSVPDQWNPVIDPQTGQTHRFISHRNPIAQTALATHSGPALSKGDGIWQVLKPGDRVLVTACAQFSGWSNTCTSARLEFK